MRRAYCLHLGLQRPSQGPSTQQALSKCFQERECLKGPSTGDPLPRRRRPLCNLATAAWVRREPQAAGVRWRAKGARPSGTLARPPRRSLQSSGCAGSGRARGGGEGSCAQRSTDAAGRPG